jgi:3-(3-hydroxy-phenyl)propionate hydroxylase
MDEPGARKSPFQFDYRRAPDQDRRVAAHHPVIIVGAGPVGLSLALDLAKRGIACVLLDDADRIGEGSRGICYAKRTLEIWHRLGVAAPMLEKGVVWQTGKVFQGDRLVYGFDLLPDGGHRMPAFINLQQYYVEKFLVEGIAREPRVDLRWRNRVTAVEPHATGARITIATPDGPYDLTCDWLLCCDGARSPTRAMLGLDFAGEVFEEQFLIADVRMAAPFPTERWFWFDPPFHSGQSALLHKQPDDIWRIDLQLSPEADADHEKQPGIVRPRIARMLGHNSFELEWVSVYRFQCRRLARFVHGRVIFAGDSAHQVSPFGARGANSGVQDAENLAWKLAMVLRQEAAERLLASYDLERGQAADENIAHSTRSTDFIAPRTAAEQRYRDAVLTLSGRGEFAKRFVNSGRLSTATVYDTPLSTPGNAHLQATARLGAPLPDAPIGRDRFLLDLLGSGFQLLHWPDGGTVPTLPDTNTLVASRDFDDPEGLVARRLDAAPGTTLLVRPDQHLAARWSRAGQAEMAAALARASGREGAA